MKMTRLMLNTDGKKSGVVSLEKQLHWQAYKNCSELNN